uniref:Kynurenine formamidase n=1 Tax=Acrobeloides nanus TaxID=290746 RepID=A0A914EMF6_9BILA
MAAEHTELDKLYTCGNWTNSGRKPAEVKEHFYTILTECYEANRKNVPVLENVDYGSQYLDIWGKDPEKADKICIFIYGGYWQEREKKYATSLVGPATEQGIPVVCINYDYATNNTMDHLVVQIGSALKFVATKFPDAKLNITVHSAGALLVVNALCQLEDASRFDELIIFSGVFQLEDLAKTYIGRNIKYRKAQKVDFVIF